jgi:uncharacterized protein YigA (DUF484 family)
MTNKMAPLEMNNDEAFLNLLSSQRQLLNQLNMENALRREQQENAFHLATTKTILGGVDPMSLMNRPIIERRSSMDYLLATRSKRGSILGGVDPMSLMNRPIIERRSSMDYLLATRSLSMSMGGDPGGMFGSPHFFGEFEDTNPKASWDNASHVASKVVMKRRRSSLGLSVVFDDQQPPSHRFSLLSNFSKSNNDIDEEDKLTGGDVFGFEKVEPPNKKIKLDSSYVDPKETKMQMEAFTSAMEKSSKSQQDIHDWDKKMGLKRSHSKTMRMTMRSRKKLCNLMKKEINAMIHSL